MVAILFVNLCQIGGLNAGSLSVLPLEASVNTSVCGSPMRNISLSGIIVGMLNIGIS